jgi:hypothetical protein
MGTEVSEEPASSILNVENLYLKVEAAGSSEIFIPNYRSTWSLSLKIIILIL